MNRELILVDRHDNVIGYGEKLEIHRQGKLHRGFSIFVINKNNELMLQQRAFSKYHSGGLWANTCCSHPLRDEVLEKTVHDRLRYEMGFGCDLEYLYQFIYHVTLNNNLTEHELDRVYLGTYDQSPKPNPNEVADWKWMDIDKLRQDLIQNPNIYVYWLKEAFEQFYQATQNK